MPNLITRSDRSPNIDDYVYISDLSGLNDGKVPISGISVIPETTRTIYLSASETAAQIQTKIDSAHKYLPENVSLTFEFLSGTYSLDARLIFGGFYGPGSLNIFGDDNYSGSTTNSTNQTTHLDFSGESVGGFLCIGNIVGKTEIRNLKITVDDGEIGIYMSQNSYGFILYNYIISTGIANTQFGIQCLGGGYTRVLRTQFTQFWGAILATHSSVILSENNDDSGTQPGRGLVVRRQGIIYKAGTQPAGSVANESIAQGGEIR